MTERAGDTPSLLQHGSAALSSHLSPPGSIRAPTISANRCSPISETDSERLPRPVAALISEGGPALCLVHGSIFVIRLRKSVLPIRQTSSCARPTLTTKEFPVFLSYCLSCIASRTVSTALCFKISAPLVHLTLIVTLAFRSTLMIN